MSKRGDKSQLDLNLSGRHVRHETRSQAAQMQVIPFVDAATLKVRRDALRRVVSSGIFQLHSTLRND